MYAIYGNIYHQYNSNVRIYTSTMDPVGIHHAQLPSTIPPTFEKKNKLNGQVGVERPSAGTGLLGYADVWMPWDLMVI